MLYKKVIEKPPRSSPIIGEGLRKSERGIVANRSARDRDEILRNGDV